MKKATGLRIFAIVLLLCLLIPTLYGCKTVHADNLCDGLTPNPVDDRATDDAFISSQMQFAVSLFQEVSATDGENLLLSPLSVQLALAMTANGAGGQTKAEMEALLGSSISLEELNEYLRTYVNGLPSGEGAMLRIANSVWFRNDEARLSVEQAFLQRVTDYYAAQVYASEFDDQTAADINDWVKNQTDGMIEKMVDQIPPEAVMYLINALAFDAEWQIPYMEKPVSNGIFTSASGKLQSVQMMHFAESRYFETDNAVGFFKDYKGGGYSFVGILPDEGVSLQDYIVGLDASALLQVMKNAKSERVSVTMPKFSYACSMELGEYLQALGITSAFGNFANFSGIDREHGLAISDVLHKTFILVDETGTKAGAASAVAVAEGIETVPINYPIILLNRPFLYMIVDNTTNLPLLIGTVASIESA